MAPIKKEEEEEDLFVPANQGTDKETRGPAHSALPLLTESHRH